MRKIILAISIALLLMGCKGAMNFPMDYSIEVMGLEKSGTGLIDRRIERIELDVSQKGYAIFVIEMNDEIQIDRKTKKIPYKIYFRLHEGKAFSIKR